MSAASISGYRILRRLGAGGMGEVFLARQESVAGLGRAVVVKTIHARHAGDDEQRRRFLDEARLAIQLQHRNICGVTNVGEAEAETFLVMDYVAGRDLRDVQRALTARQRRMGPSLVLYILKEILDALDYAHRMVDPRSGAPLGLVHRDVSPSNIMISLEGEVKLIDFGHAMSTLKVERTAVGTLIGKIRYMSPEQARGETVDGRSDVYSAAIIGAELLVGSPFHAGTLDAQLLAAVQRGDRSSALDAVDEDIRALLEAGLMSDRAKRVGSAQMCRACEGLLFARREVVGLADLRALMRELFPEELSRQREQLAEVLTDDQASSDAASDVGFFSRLETAASEEPPTRELTQVIRRRAHGTATQKLSARPRRLVAITAALVLALAVAGSLTASRLLRDEDSTGRPSSPAMAATGPPMPSSFSQREQRAPVDVDGAVGKLVETVVEAEVVGTSVAEPQPALGGPVPPAKRALVRATPKTTKDKLELLQRCKQRCAPIVVDKHRRFTSLSLDEARGLAVELDACVKLCG